MTPYIQSSGCQEDPLDIEPSSEAFLKFWSLLRAGVGSVALSPSPQQNLIKPALWRLERCRPDSAWLFPMFSGCSLENCRIFESISGHIFIMILIDFTSWKLVSWCHVSWRVICGVARTWVQCGSYIFESSQTKLWHIVITQVTHHKGSRSISAYHRLIIVTRIQETILLIKLLKQSTHKDKECRNDHCYAASDCSKCQSDPLSPDCTSQDSCR